MRVKAIEIAKKDLKIEFRTKSTLNFMLLFSLITSMVISVTIPPTIAGRIAPSLLWIVFIFVGMLGYGKAFLREVELETLDALRLSPVSPSSVLFGKVLYNVVLMLIVEAFVIPIFIALFNVTVKNVPLLFLTFTVGNVGFVVAESALSTLVVKARMRETLLPVLTFPVVFPVIISTVIAVRSAMEGVLYARPLVVVACFTVLILAVSATVFDYSFVD